MQVFKTYIPQLVGALKASGAQFIDLVYWRGAPDKCEIRRLYSYSFEYADLWDTMQPFVKLYCSHVSTKTEPNRAPWEKNIIYNNNNNNNNNNNK